MLSLVPLTGLGRPDQPGPADLRRASGRWSWATSGAAGPLWGLVPGHGDRPRPIGVLVALPALRLQGLYLALTTASFAVFMEKMFFNQSMILPNASLNVPRLVARPGRPSTATRPTSSCCRSSFGLVALFLVWLRRGEFARRLLAMKASPAACVTLGLNLTRTKLAGLRPLRRHRRLRRGAARGPVQLGLPRQLPLPAGPADRAAGGHRRHRGRGRRPLRRPDLRRRLLHHPRHRPVADQHLRPQPGAGRGQPRAEPERRRQRDRAQRQGEAGPAQGPRRGRPDRGPGARLGPPRAWTSR